MTVALKKAAEAVDSRGVSSTQDTARDDKLTAIEVVLRAASYTEAQVAAAIAALSGDTSPLRPQAPEQYLTPKVVCRILDISPTTLWRLGKQGLPHVLIGQRKRYLLSEIRSFLDGNRGGAQ